MRVTKTLAVPFLLAAALPAQAATRDEVYQAMQRCNVINDNRVWMDCVYGAMQPMRAELHLQPAPEGQVRLVPPAGSAPMSVPMNAGPRAPVPVTHAPPKKEGVVAYVLGGRKQVEAMPLTDYHFDGAGHFTITLGNGQVWRQVDDDSHLAQWRAPAGRYVASIRTGSMGSSILQVKGESGAFMVRQVQ